MSVVARGRAAQLQEPEAIALAKKFYDEKGPFVGAFSMAIPVLSAHRNRGYGGRAEWSIKYRVEPDTGDEYFVRFFYQRPFGAPGWEVQNMHLCDGNCSASCVKRPHEGFGTARCVLGPQKRARVPLRQSLNRPPVAQPRPAHLPHAGPGDEGGRAAQHVRGQTTGRPGQKGCARQASAGLR
jgi:hypothetical protein